MTYYVGGSQQFTHSETDTNGSAIPQELGRWSVSNPAVASITQSGLATWLAAGETEVTFVIQSYKRAGSLHAVVHSAVPASLAGSPSAVSVPAGSAAKLTISARDADGNPITDLVLDSATSDDESIADVLLLEGTDLLVLGVADGTCTITVTSAAASVQIDVAVTPPIGGGGGGGGAVSSVFGRTGAVASVAGDYDVSEITGAATAASVTAEASTRAAADSTLQANIDAEAGTRSADDSTLAGLITAEANTRASADTTLQGNIDAEATTRGTADTSEASARTTADSTLQANIDAEATARTSADSAESAARIAADLLLAPLASPALTGAPTAPTPLALDNSTSIATTAYTDAAVGVEATARATAITTEAAARVATDALKAPLASPSLTGAPTAPTQAALDNSTKIATTGYADAAVAVEASARAAAIVSAVAALVNAAPGLLDTLKELADAIGDDPNFAATMTAALALKAPLASPALTGTPTVPTAAPATNTTQAASTAYSDAAVAVEAAARAGADTTESAARVAADALLAPLASPALTGNPTAPTQAAGNNSTRVGTTAYADAAVGVEAARAAAAEALKAPLASPALTGTPTVPTAAGGTNTTQAASTAFVHGEVATEASARSTADALLAPIASPTFTGTPAAPTPTAADNTTKIATTAFVTAAVAAAGGGAVSSVFGRVGAVVKASGDYAVADVTGAAPLASPALTGHPTGVTEAALDNSTRLASTAYADAAVAVENSRATTAEALKAPLASPALTGNPTVPTQTALNNSTRAASTAYADAAVAVENSRATTAEALLAPKASPALTGSPTAPTPPAADSSTLIATTAFVADNDMGLSERYSMTAGGLASTYPRTWPFVAPGGQVISSAQLYLNAIFLRKGMSLSAIRYYSVGAGASMTHQWFALFDASRNLLCTTADDTSTAWGANSLKSLAITGAPFVTTYTGWYYVGVCVVTASTVPTMYGAATGSATQVEGAAPIVAGTSTGSLTTPASCPATAGAITVANKRHYVEVA